MKVKPTSNWKLLGTDAELDTNVEYEASWARNQPDWVRDRKLFVHYPEPTGFLLKQGDYVITEPDPPVDALTVAALLQTWLSAVDIPDTEEPGEEGMITLNDNAMLQLIEMTRNQLKEIKQ